MYILFCNSKYAIFNFKSKLKDVDSKKLYIFYLHLNLLRISYRVNFLFAVLWNSFNSISKFYLLFMRTFHFAKTLESISFPLISYVKEI